MSQREKLWDARWDEWREERVPHLCMLPAPSACRPRPAAPLPFSRRPCPVPAPGSLHAAPAVCTLPVPSTRHGLLRPLALPLGPRPRPLQANPALHRLHTFTLKCAGSFLTPGAAAALQRPVPPAALNEASMSCMLCSFSIPRATPRVHHVHALSMPAWMPSTDIFLPIRGGNPMERQWPQEEKLEDEGEMQEAHHGSTFETHHVRHDSNRLRVPGLLTLDLLAREILATVPVS
ncbi:hypothetical protein GGX14DRAFT_572677 [Mycena pura]|uniref:Uncharacterized protein n=1 Tax=Mycena pura TaxID=153505 RepID=A0AAD6Y511_9AGAR|nr:hypothetical protein GGX14DRAFT_572677 [Mycena pura]